MNLRRTLKHDNPSDGSTVITGDVANKSSPRRMTRSSHHDNHSQVVAIRTAGVLIAIATLYLLSFHIFSVENPLVDNGVLSWEQQHPQCINNDIQNVNLTRGWDIVCGNNNINITPYQNRIKHKTNKYFEWDDLCDNGLVQQLNQGLANHGHVFVVQIGAHVGFEENDPIANGMLSFLKVLSVEERQQVHWIFVEPSPANYAVLVKNVEQYSHLCDITVINKAVVSDFMSEQDFVSMPFYSILDTIDTKTGYDSKSGKTFPHWITQVSSFSREKVNLHTRAFSRLGLSMEDYIVVTNVTTTRYSDLMEQIMQPSSTDDAIQSDKQTCKQTLALMLIDTEGFDCDIIMGIHKNTKFLAEFLLFEHVHCGKQKALDTVQYLTDSLGYNVSVHQGENYVASLKKSTE